MEDLNSLLEQLRQRNAAESSMAKLQRQQQSYQQLSEGMNNTTIGGQTMQGNIGGQSFAIPTEQKVDWGSILGKFGANYMAAKKGKEIDEKAEEQNALSEQFFSTTLRDDPKAAQLFTMHRMGMPGADKALENHLAPKKEALAGLIQGITSGAIDPAMARELAPRYGVDPEVAANAAGFAVKNKEALSAQKFDQQRELKMMGINAANMRAARSDAARAARGRGARVSIGDGMTESNEALNYDLTPGERQVRAKEMEKMDKEIQKADQQLQKFDSLRSSLETDNTFGVGQKTADILAKSPISVLSTIGTSLRNKSAVMLEDYLNSETLTRMAQLGGNDSNEELNRMRASLPQVANNKEAALALMDQLNEWQKDTKAAIQAKRSDYASGRYFEIGDQAPDYYRSATDKRKISEPEVPKTLAPTKGKIKILSID